MTTDTPDESRSIQRRKAAQRGEPPPEFSAQPTPHVLDEASVKAVADKIARARSWLSLTNEASAAKALEEMILSSVRVAVAHKEPQPMSGSERRTREWMTDEKINQAADNIIHRVARLLAEKSEKSAGHAPTLDDRKLAEEITLEVCPIPALGIVADTPKEYIHEHFERGEAAQVAATNTILRHLSRHTAGLRAEVKLWQDRATKEMQEYHDFAANIASALGWDTSGKTMDEAIRAMRQRVEELEKALVRLENAADAFAADQSGEKDPRCGAVQPVTVAQAVHRRRPRGDGGQVVGQFDF